MSSSSTVLKGHWKKVSQSAHRPRGPLKERRLRPRHLWGSELWEGLWWELSTLMRSSSSRKEFWPGNQGTKLWVRKVVRVPILGIVPSGPATGITSLGTETHSGTYHRKDGISCPHPTLRKTAWRGLCYRSDRCSRQNWTVLVSWVVGGSSCHATWGERDFASESVCFCRNTMWWQRQLRPWSDFLISSSRR